MTTSGVIDAARARTLAGTRWFEKFEVELKRHATLVDVVPDSETFRFGPGAVKKFSYSYFPDCCGTKRVLLGRMPSGRAGPLVAQLGSGEADYRRQIDVAEKTIEFRTIQNAKVLSGSVWLVI